MCSCVPRSIANPMKFKKKKKRRKKALSLGGYTHEEESYTI